MKRLILLITIIISTLSFAQEKGKIVLDEKSHKNMYVGYGDLTVFKDTSFSTWYGAEYDVYQPDK